MSRRSPDTRNLRESRRPEDPPAWWPTALASAFVVTSLAALGAIPIWAASRIEVLRTEIEVVAEPTHPLAARLQFMIAREAASVRGYLVTPEDSFLDRAREARAIQQEIYSQLEPLARRLSPALIEHLAEHRASADRWHSVQDSLYGGQLTRAAYASRLLEQRGRYRRTLEAAAVFDSVLAEETGRRRAEILAVERRNFILSTLLALAALIAAVVVGWLTRRERLFALANARLYRESQRAAGRWQLLAETSEILATVRDQVASLQGVARLVVDRFADWCTIDLLGGRGAHDLVPVASAHADPEREPRLETTRTGDGARNLTLEVAEQTVASGQPLYLAAGATPSAAPVSDPAAELLRQLGSKSLISAPLVARGETIGALTIASIERGVIYDEHDVKVVVALAGRTALAVDTARLYESAVAGDRAKTQFLAVVSHELRTPLNAIVGYADLLHDEVSGSLSDVQRRYVTRIRVGADHLLHLIEEILAFANLEAQSEGIRAERTNVSELVGQAITLIEPAATAKRLRVTSALPMEPLLIETDPAKVRRILANLLANAVKFTKAGEIDVSVFRQGDEIRIAVRDTGIGIPAEQLTGIFRPFWQLEDATTRRAGGLGLGLGIASRLATQLGGSLGVESTPGRGSTFTLRLPAADARGA